MTTRQMFGYPVNSRGFLYLLFALLLLALLLLALLLVSLLLLLLLLVDLSKCKRRRNNCQGHTKENHNTTLGITTQAFESRQSSSPTRHVFCHS